MKTLNALTEDFKAMGLKGGIVEETELLPVIFRKFKKEGDIVALFPTLPGTDDPETCMSYMHVGQHGSASTDLMRIGTAPATPEEYSDLLKELKEIYEPDVKLVVKPRITPEMDRQRIDALRESRKGSGKREVEDKSVGAIAELKKLIQEQGSSRKHLGEAFSRQHYRAIAEILKTISKEGERKEIANKFVEMFKQDNPAFKPELFLKACGL